MKTRRGLIDSYKGFDRELKNSYMNWIKNGIDLRFSGKFQYDKYSWSMCTSNKQRKNSVRIEDRNTNP